VGSWLKVGHATRSIEDCLVEGGKDTTIRTALLDARYIAGDSKLFTDFHQRFRQACKEAGVAEYIAAKQDERAARHRRYGDSPFLVEPNVKEGRGGLRDIQTLYWIARYFYDNDPNLPKLLAPGRRFVLGHTKRDTLDIVAPWTEVKLLKHGDSLMRFFEREK